MSRTAALAAVLSLVTLGACATKSDVEARGADLELRLDPARRNYCPPEPLARGLAEVAFARSASERGDPIAAKVHLDRAERFAEAADAEPCTPPVLPERPPVIVPDAPPPPDLDRDGQPDASDPDDDNDGASDIVDQCPREAEDMDGFEDIDGCPEPGGPASPP